jgi:restriction endonuclease S subunit
MSWRKVTLGEILTESKIISANPNPDKRITVRLKVLGVEKRGLENEVEGATKQFVRKAGQFIYGKQNFHKGAFGIVPKELDGFESSSDLPAFDIDEACLPEFLFYFFKQGNYYLELAKIASGVATQRINTTQLFELEMPLPDIETQKQVISNIKSLEKNGDAISTELTHQLTLLKKLRQQLLQDAVQGKLISNEQLVINNEETGQQLLAKIKAEKEQLIAEKKLKKEKELAPITADEIPFDIPENWVWCRLGEVVSLITSGSRNWNKYYSKEGVLFIRSQNIKPTQIDLTNKAFVKLPNSTEGKRTAVEKDDILITITGAGVSNAGLLTEMFFDEGYISQHVALVRLMMNQIAYWVHFCIISDCIGKSQFSKMIYGDKPGLNLAQLNSLIIPLPPLSQQNLIVQKLDELMQYCNELEASIQESQVQNQQLLQQVLREALRK